MSSDNQPQSSKLGLNVAIFGAGSIGCYIGGCLAYAGASVTLIGRPRMLDTIRTNGLTVTDYLGRKQRVPAEALTLSSDAVDATGSDLVLLTVKSAATAEAAQELSKVLRSGVPVISFQNGIGNADVMAPLLPANPCIPGMVPFNVLALGEGKFHQGTEGHLVVQETRLPHGTEDLFSTAKLTLKLPKDIRPIQWGKLLINLNNCVNALSGVPLKEELSQRGYRLCVAGAMREALKLMTKAGIEPAKATNLPPKLVPWLMSVPDWIFVRLASKMLAIDPLARSSMWEDLEAGRRTEIDWINGQVVNLAEQLGTTAPVNSKLIALIRQAEQGGKRDWSAKELASAVLS